MGVTNGGMTIEESLSSVIKHASFLADNNFRDDLVDSYLGHVNQFLVELFDEAVANQGALSLTTEQITRIRSSYAIVEAIESMHSLGKKPSSDLKTFRNFVTQFTLMGSSMLNAAVSRGGELKKNNYKYVPTVEMTDTDELGLTPEKLAKMGYD